MSLHRLPTLFERAGAVRAKTISPKRGTILVYLTLLIGCVTGMEAKPFIIATSDYDGNEKTRDFINEELNNYRKETGLPLTKALWLRDARSGSGEYRDNDHTFTWESTRSALYYMCDLPTMIALRAAGITHHVGLWVRRGGRDGEPMRLEHRLGSMEYVPDDHPDFSVAADVDAVERELADAHVLVVPGGNPFSLMEQLRSPDGARVWALLRAKVMAGELVYISRSAGTIVTGANIDVTAEFDMTASQSVAGLDLQRGLVPRPHYRRAAEAPHKFREPGAPRATWSHDEFFANLESAHGVTPDRIVPLKDGEFLMQKGGEMRAYAPEGELRAAWSAGASPPAAVTWTPPNDEPPAPKAAAAHASRIGIIVPIDEEAQALLKVRSMPEVAEFFPEGFPTAKHAEPLLADDTVFGRVYVGERVVIVSTGTDEHHGGVSRVGKVAAALATYAALAKYRCALVVKAGTVGVAPTAGGIGDVFLGDSFVYHDRRIALPGYDAYGLGALRASIPDELAAFSRKRGWTRATVSTGDSLDFPATDKAVFEAAGASVKDMETAAIAEVAKMFKENFISLNVAVDVLGHDSSKEFVRHESRARATLLRELQALVRFVATSEAEGRTLEDMFAAPEGNLEYAQPPAAALDVVNNRKSTIAIKPIAVAAVAVLVGWLMMKR